LDDFNGRDTKLSHVNLLSASWAATIDNEAKRLGRAKDRIIDKGRRMTMRGDSETARDKMNPIRL
jgi:hypothetical protein